MDPSHSPLGEVLLVEQGCDLLPDLRWHRHCVAFGRLGGLPVVRVGYTIADLVGVAFGALLPGAAADVALAFSGVILPVGEQSGHLVAHLRRFDVPVAGSTDVPHGEQGVLESDVVECFLPGGDDELVDGLGWAVCLDFAQDDARFFDVHWVISLGVSWLSPRRWSSSRANDMRFVQCWSLSSWRLSA